MDQQPPNWQQGSPQLPFPPNNNPWQQQPFPQQPNTSYPPQQPFPPPQLNQQQSTSVPATATYDASTASASPTKEETKCCPGVWYHHRCFACVLIWFLVCDQQRCDKTHSTCANGNLTRAPCLTYSDECSGHTYCYAPDTNNYL